MIEEILYLKKVCTLENRSNLHYFSLSVEKGTIHLVTGTDSSGMLLLPEILTGKVCPSSGSIYYDGKKLQFDTYTRMQAEKMGIFYIGAELAVMRELTITENLSYKKLLGWSWTVFRKKENENLAKEFFQKYGIHLDIKIPIYRLTRGQICELLICKAILCGVKLLICQEIGEGFSNQEMEEIRNLLFRLKEKGVSIILLNVNFESAMSFADYISVMRDGMVCYSAETKEASLYSIYKCLESNPDIRICPQKILPVQAHQQIFLDVMFEQKKMIVSIKTYLVPGQITGIVTREVPATSEEYLFYYILAGKFPIRGRVYQNGKVYPLVRWLRKNRREICYLGIRFWDREVFQDLTVGENIVLSAVSRYGGYWSKSMEKLMLKEFAEKYGIEVEFDAYPKQIDTGEYNQIVLWRFLFYPPKYLILSNPMFGADEPLREKLLETLFILQGTGTYILWSHNQEGLLEKYCSYIEYPEYISLKKEDGV